jgi:hypothetical protein
MELLKRIKDRAPEYDSSLEDLISRFTVLQGGRAGTASGSSSWEQGKYFSTKYEIYMYATLLGMRLNYRLPISASDKSKFIEIKSWQPNDLADYIIMAALAVSGLDFNELENKHDKDVEKEVSLLKRIIEEYANGGFDKLRAKFESDSSYFENNDNCFVDLLDDSF